MGQSKRSVMKYLKLISCSVYYVWLKKLGIFQNLQVDDSMRMTFQQEQLKWERW